MEWNVIDLKLIDAWKVLILANVKNESDVPKKYLQEVQIRVAERTIEVLTDV